MYPPQTGKTNKGEKKLSLTIFPVWTLFFFPAKESIYNKNCIIFIDSLEIWIIAKPEPNKTQLYINILL